MIFCVFQWSFYFQEPEYFRTFANKSIKNECPIAMRSYLTVVCFPIQKIVLTISSKSHRQIRKQVIPLSAQEKPDSTAYRFRFMAHKDMFFTPWSGNGRELDRLIAAIDENRSAIEAGRMYLLVTSYGTDGNEEQSAAQVSKTRRNRVKSDLIVRGKVKESHFVTDQSFDEAYMDEDEKSLRNIVIVTLPAPVVKVAEIAGEEAAAKVTPYHFALRADLLRWATLTPDLGVEWRINRHVGIAVNGTYTSWSWDDRNRRYALWEVNPEVRYYIGEQKAWYVGAMFKTGQFNYKLSGTGKQGDLTGGGITGGYQLKLNKALSIDFNLGLGYLNADYEKYKVIDGVRVRQGKESKNWWGPFSAGVTLVWTIF